MDRGERQQKTGVFGGLHQLERRQTQLSYAQKRSLLKVSSCYKIDFVVFVCGDYVSCGGHGLLPLLIGHTELWIHAL